MRKRSVRLYLNGNPNSLTRRESTTRQLTGTIMATTTRRVKSSQFKPFSFGNVDFFSGLTYRPLVSVKNGHRKRVFSKTLSRVEIFENAGLSFS